LSAIRGWIQAVKQELVQFEAVTLQGGVYLPGPPVDSPSEGTRALQTVAVKPSTAIEDVPAPVIVKNDSFFRGTCEEIVLNFLSEEC